MHSRLPPFRTERGRMGHPSCLCDLDLHLERVATFQSQVSSKTMIWELSGCRPFGEEHVVVLAAVEGRVEVDEVYRLVLDVLTQDFEIVAVIELIFLHWGKILTRIGGLRNCSSGCVVGMPGGVIVERTDAGSLDSVADSLRDADAPLRMTMYGLGQRTGRWPRLSRSLRKWGGSVITQDERAFSPPTLPHRTRKNGAPCFVCDLDLHLERTSTFHSQVSSKAMIWELERVPSFSAKSTL